MSQTNLFFKSKTINSETNKPFILKNLAKFFLNNLASFVEPVIFSHYPFSLTQSLGPINRVNVLGKFIILKLFPKSLGTEYEVSALVYSEADQRMLIPILQKILDRAKLHNQKIRVTLVLLKEMSPEILKKLTTSGCHVEKDHLSLIRACMQPKQKLVLLCLDQRYTYEFHKLGVDTADMLRKFGVKTVSIQHGGTREDSVRGLASSASDIILVWGQRVYRELINKYGVHPEKLRLVGNHLQDRIILLKREAVLAEIIKSHPDASNYISAKKIVLLATCLHREYQGRENEKTLYADYIKHIYSSLDFSKIFLIIKMHPIDTVEPNLYQDFLPKELKDGSSVLIIQPGFNQLDVYSLIYISDLVITRASTVAEEALLMSKKVIAFDIDENGPSSQYKHLEEYGKYKIVYSEPKNSLSEAVFNSLYVESNIEQKAHLDIEKELAFSLDGKSIDRTTDEIFKILNI